MTVARGMMTITRPLVYSTLSEFFTDIDPADGYANSGDIITFDVRVTNTVLHASIRPTGTVSVININDGYIFVSGTLGSTDSSISGGATLITAVAGGSYNLAVSYHGVISNNSISFKPSLSDPISYTINKFPSL